MDINCGYKRWLLGSIIDKVNIYNKRVNNLNIEKVTEKLNEYHDQIAGDGWSRPFIDLENILIEKVNSILSEIEAKNYSKIIFN